jgi:hypothetical protein
MYKWCQFCIAKESLINSWQGYNLVHPLGNQHEVSQKERNKKIQDNNKEKTDLTYGSCNQAGEVILIPNQNRLQNRVSQMR